jgi:hypothetical protein
VLISNTLASNILPELRAFNLTHIGVSEMVLALVWSVEVADRSDGFPEFLNSAGADASQMGLELGKRITIGLRSGL